MNEAKKQKIRVLNYMLSESEDETMAEFTVDRMAQNVAQRAMGKLKDSGAFIGWWIPVAEGMPEDGTWNLFTNGKVISVERYKTDAIDHFYPNGRWFSFDETIAWMPLPDPYVPQESEEEEDGKN